MKIFESFDFLPRLFKLSHFISRVKFVLLEKKTKEFFFSMTIYAQRLHKEPMKFRFLKMSAKKRRMMTIFRSCAKVIRLHIKHVLDLQFHFTKIGVEDYAKKAENFNERVHKHISSKKLQTSNIDFFN